MIVSPLGQEHVAAIAALHCESLPGDFLPTLGRRFLEVLYRAMLELGVAIGQVAKEGEQVQGFVIGTLDSGGLFGRVLQRKTFSLSIEVARALLRRPRLLWPTLETVLYPVKESADGVPKAELLVIAVQATRRNSAVGQRLLEHFEADLRARGAAAYKVTVLERNAGARRFYERAGFARAHGFRLYRKDWLLYTKPIARAARAAQESKNG